MICVRLQSVSKLKDISRNMRTTNDKLDKLFFFFFLPSFRDDFWVVIVFRWIILNLYKNYSCWESTKHCNALSQRKCETSSTEQTHGCKLGVVYVVFTRHFSCLAHRQFSLCWTHSLGCVVVDMTLFLGWWNLLEIFWKMMFASIFVKSSTTFNNVMRYSQAVPSVSVHHLSTQALLQ